MYQTEKDIDELLRLLEIELVSLGEDIALTGEEDPGDRKRAEQLKHEIREMVNRPGGASIIHE